jgi:hypothetical protein
LIKTESAIAALKRAASLPPLTWSDALFLASQKHCLNQRSQETPSVMNNMRRGNRVRRQRPEMLVYEFAEAKDIEMTVASGEDNMDLVINNVLSP